MIVIVDYGAGNIQSVVNVLKHFNVDFCLAQKEKTLLVSDGIILPGVGSFGAAMKALNDKQLVTGILNACGKGIPLFGICLGLQMLFESSEESEDTKGLGLIKGKVKRLQSDGRKIPHIGWSSLSDTKGRLMNGITEGEFFYFVHSYAAHVENSEDSTATAQYGERFDACVERDNIFGCQFHPEKSSQAGLKIIKNFLKISGEINE